MAEPIWIRHKAALQPGQVATLPTMNVEHSMRSISMGKRIALFGDGQGGRELAVQALLTAKLHEFDRQVYLTNVLSERIESEQNGVPSHQVVS
ncbi:hypothetical protein NLM16_16045 [Bradyrhizobium brasilense]|uniref:hypothetical protein n=1 Tax=Bradyrhizobium brasilense TaxID=1419277 RepID=UPI00287757D0|nr:hypothetical protein [Bradyrhizobium brasilense]MCP3415625.1 hypothetical protein [Bradyrhizobium brasilense]